MLSQEDCEVWLPNILDVPGMPGEVGDKPIFLKLLRSLWAKHWSFDTSTTILVDDYRYKSLKNDYKDFLAIRSYELTYLDPYYPLYLKDLVHPLLEDWIFAPHPIAYSLQHPLFDIEDDVSPLVTDYFIQW